MGLLLRIKDDVWKMMDIFGRHPNDGLFVVIFADTSFGMHLVWYMGYFFNPLHGGEDNYLVLCIN